MTGTELGFVSVMVSNVTPPVEIWTGLNTMETVGGASTISVACAAEPVPAFAVVTLPVESVYVLGAPPVIFTLTVQLELAGMVAPLSERDVLFVIAVPPPVQLVNAPEELASMPEG